MDIRKEIMADLHDSSGRYVWLRGSAGLGKTAISKSIAEQLKMEKRLAASFFFDKSGRTQNTNSSEYFITTLAFQLADFYPPYRQALFRDLISEDAVISRQFGEKQLRDLIISPLESITDSTSTVASFPSSVIVLDGLDECGAPVDLESLMNIIVALSKLPPTIKIFVSCRPEREVFDAWPRHPEVATHDVDRIPLATMYADILKHVQQSLEKLPPRRSTQWPPPLSDITLFAERCRGHFEIARIRLRIVQESRGVSSEEAFKCLLEETNFRVLGVDEEYQRILRRAFPPPVSAEGLEQSEIKLRTSVRQRYRTVVGALIALRGHGLSSAGLSILLQMKKIDVEQVLGSISCIINVPDSPWEPIAFFHATCPEFLRGPPLKTSRGTDKVFFFPNEEGNMLGVHCLKLLVQNLRPGRLLNLESHRHSSIERRGVVLPLEYAAGNWEAHVSKLPASELQELPAGLLERFMANHFLAWLEFMLLIQLSTITDLQQPVFVVPGIICDRLISLYHLLSREVGLLGQFLLLGLDETIFSGIQ